MNPILIATIAGLVTALCWGFSDWLSAKSAKRAGPIDINFAVQFGGLFVTAIILMFWRIQIPDFSEFWRIAVGSSLITVAYLIFIKALSSGPIGIVAPIGNSYPLVTVFLSVIFLAAVFTIAQYVAIILIILGAAVLAYEKNPRKVPIIELHKEAGLAVIAAFIWGIAFFILEPVVGKISWQTMAVFSEIVATCVAILMLVAVHGSKSGVAAKQAIQSKTAITAGIVGTAGIAALYLGSDYAGSIIIPAVLSSGSTLIASVLGALFDHEKLGALKRAGAVLVVAGIVILNLA